MGNDEPDDLELSRRILADLEELNVEFHIGMDQVLTKLHAAEDGLKVEAMGMAPRTFGDDTPLKLRDAIYLPILGGEVLRNGARTPSPTFKVSSLEGAIKSGHLEGRIIRGGMTLDELDEDCRDDFVKFLRRKAVERTLEKHERTMAKYHEQMAKYDSAAAARAGTRRKTLSRSERLRSCRNPSTPRASSSSRLPPCVIWRT